MMNSTGFKKSGVNLKLLGARMNCSGIFPLSKDGAFSRQEWDTFIIVGEDINSCGQCDLVFRFG